MAFRSPKAPRILFARTGVGSAFDALINGVGDEGYVATARPSSPLSPDGAKGDELRGIDMVFLVLRDSASTPHTLQQALRDAGVMQGRLGMDRVVLLVEDPVQGVSPDCGVAYIRFPVDRPEAVLEEVLGRLGATFHAPERDLHERIPVSTQARSPALRVPWALVAVVLAAALIPLVVALRAVTSDRPLAEAAPAPASPEADNGRTASSLASCTLNLSSSRLLDEAVTCTGPGQLLIEGDLGPWHSAIASIAVDEGVVGQLDYEPQGDRPTGFDLAPGTVALDDRSLSTGVRAITLWFDRDHQHVHLFRQRDLQGGVAILTYLIDR